MATVVLVGTLDTKGTEYAYFRDRLSVFGADVTIIDVGLLHDSDLGPDVDRRAVASASGTDVDELVAEGRRGDAVAAMSRGAGTVLLDLYRSGRLDAVAGMGGSGGTSLISAAMQTLPIGVPKVLVSTMASGDVRPYVGGTDVTMMYSVVDIAGINSVSAQVLTNAAVAVAGMAAAHESRLEPVGSKPVIGATMFGLTMPGVTAAREWLEGREYEVLIFHATGSGGMAMESLVAEGRIAGVLDATPTEVVDELVGGVLSAGPRRLEIAGRMGVPQVVSLGALDMANFGPIDTVPDRYHERNLFRHNPGVTLMRTTAEECVSVAREIAAKLNAATGPVSVFVPKLGFSGLDVAGGPFYDPDADAALIDELRTGLDASVDIVEMDVHINDVAFGEAMARRLDEHLQKVSSPA